MNISTIILFLITILYTIYSNGKTRRISRDRFESLRGRVSSMDKHLHDLIDSNYKKSGRDFHRFLSLMGYKKMDLNKEENLVLVENFKGKLFVSEDRAGAQFVPVTEMTNEKGVSTVQYEGKTLLFKTKDTDF